MNRNKINWQMPSADAADMGAVIIRAKKMMTANNVKFNPVDLAMDIRACHLNGCRLDLKKLLNAPALDFAHDIGGIRSHLDRKTGQLTDCFVPRCAEPEEKDAA